MPQLDRTRGGGIIELMNHEALAKWCRQAIGGVDWLQIWWIQLHGKPATAAATSASGDGTSIGFHQDKVWIALVHRFRQWPTPCLCAKS
eukprot:SAG31_NODE_850_length_11521_cov_47.558396_14_plen_89_part_00